MSKNKIKYFSSGEFARLCGVHKKTLFHYDDIDLFKPEKVEDNGYRYYSQDQLESFNVIHILKEVGMPLKQIKEVIDKRSPKNMIDLFEEETNKIENEIRDLRRKQELMYKKVELIKEGINKTKGIFIEEQEEEHIILSNPTKDTDEYYDIETYTKHLDYCTENNILMSQQPGSIISKESLKNKDYTNYSYFFTKIDNEINNIDYTIKPKGLYVVGYMKGYYDKTYILHKKIVDYIEKNNLYIKGCSYEEVLIDEVAVIDRDEYIIKICIEVGKINN
ncbi:MerR family transcriptional regulator [Romboutsia weinsteinii]|uniref:MerR family transcriptional regulator n=1 Tax=Romboutsia weinsteinii TaxID=2020949 RepID=A0A371J2G1_9FIRM|nr:MerR family transcriptional regulator [Romboutsia weinsteinii]RDY26905.1 MerR family transcriptional regulator [Romboutsia weinsteinii]